MPISLELIGQVLAALVVSFLIALILTPVVRNLAVKVGAALYRPARRGSAAVRAG